MVAETSEEANVTGGRGRINPLDCAHCGLRCGSSDDDPCIENLPGVMNACCGHGKPEHAYIQYSCTSLLSGRAAFEKLQELRNVPPAKRRVGRPMAVIAGCFAASAGIVIVAQGFFHADWVPLALVSGTALVLAFNPEGDGG